MTHTTVNKQQDDVFTISDPWFNSVSPDLIVKTAYAYSLMECYVWKLKHCLMLRREVSYTGVYWWLLWWCCSVFAQVPEARSLFERVGGDDTSSPKFIGHAMRVLAGIDIAINLLDQPEALRSQLEHLHEQHDERHIPDRYFKVLLTAQCSPTSRTFCDDQSLESFFLRLGVDLYSNRFVGH